MWEHLYRYYIFDLSCRDRSNNSGMSLYITGTNNTLRQINLICIVVYEKYGRLNCISGKYQPLTSRFD